jgi:hypothetical protein
MKKNGIISLGTKETKELLAFLGQFATTTDTVLADGKVDLLELTQFVQVVFMIKPAIEGIREVPRELADLSDDERAEVVDAFAKSLKLRNEQADQLADQGFDLALRLVQFITRIGELKRGTIVAA